jgi:hypothetical protein
VDVLPGLENCFREEHVRQRSRLRFAHYPHVGQEGDIIIYKKKLEKKKGANIFFPKKFQKKKRAGSKNSRNHPSTEKKNQNIKIPFCTITA